MKKEILGRFYKETSSLSTMRDELNKIYKQGFIEQLFSLYYVNSSLEYTGCKETITILLHLFHVFSVSGQERNKSLVLQGLTTLLAQKSETDLNNIFNEYIDQLMTKNSMVTEEDLCIREIDPYYELLFKLCYGEKLIKQEKYEQYNEFMVKNVDVVMSMIKEMKTRKNYKNMSKTCIFLLHVLNIDTSWHQPGGLWNQEECTCLLFDLLSMLPEGLFYGTFMVYLGQRQTMNLSVRFEDLCPSMGRISPYSKLKLILVYCEKLIKQKHYDLYQQFMVQNLKLLIDLKIKVGCNESRRTIVSHDCNKSCDQMNTLWNNEEYRIKKLTSLLSCLLCLLPEDELYETISHYLFLIKNMKSDIVPKYLHSVKTDPYLKLLFKLFWWRKLIKEGHADNNIVSRCLNDFCREKCRENRAEFIAQIISIIDNLSEKSFLKELLQCYLRKNLKTVTSMATTEHGKERCECNKEMKYAKNMSKQSLIYTQCASIFSGNKMKNVDIKYYLRKLNMKGPEDENEVEMQSHQVKLLILFILLLLVTALGHKSAKLKKYLALKYEYHMASLYLLWCSGDIEVHPGPPWNKKQLKHDSERERKWLQDINSILLKLYWGIPTHSKQKNLWQRKPDHWPYYKPFHDTKNTQSKTLSDEEILTCLLECLVKKNIVIPQKYQFEISAWRNRMIQLLHKVHVLRSGVDNAKSAILNLLLAHLEYEVNSLKDIKVSFENSTFDKMEAEDILKNNQRQKKQAEMVADIIRDLISKLCRLSRGKDPAQKCDGIWNHPPPDYWPPDVPFFNPYNRGKYQDTCPDNKLLATFLQLPHMKIPMNLKVLVDAFQTMCNCTNAEEKNKNKGNLCREYILQSNMAKLENALQYMHEEGLFSKEVYAILNQWQTTQSVDEQAEHILKSANGRSDERPHISIKITRNSQDTNIRDITYTISINNAYLHIKCTTIPPSQPSQDQPIAGSLTTANNQENKDDSVIPPGIIQFLSDYGFGKQTEIPKDKLVSVKDKCNGHETSDLKQQRKVLSLTQAYQETQTIPTTYTNQSSDIDRIGINYNKKCPQTGDCYSQAPVCASCDYNANGNIVDSLGNGNAGTSTAKKRKLSEDNEDAMKQLKTKCYQLGHFDRTDEDTTLAESKNGGETLEPNECNNSVLDSLSLHFSFIDQMNDVRYKCESLNWEDSESDQQTCDLESLKSPNPQVSLENSDDVKNNQNNLTDDKELENCLDLANYISGKPSEIETFLSQQPSIL